MCLHISVPLVILEMSFISIIRYQISVLAKYMIPRGFMDITMIFFLMHPDLSLAFWNDFLVHFDYNLNSLTWPIGVQHNPILILPPISCHLSLPHSVWGLLVIRQYVLWTTKGFLSFRSLHCSFCLKYLLLYFFAWMTSHHSGIGY